MADFSISSQLVCLSVGDALFLSRLRLDTRRRGFLGGWSDHGAIVSASLLP
jgi:hypothetical protein